MKHNAIFCTFLLPIFIDFVSGHGMLMDPASRNSMWRKGYPNPINYNDNELYCGGFVVQYNHNNGKCGVCGDNYKAKKPRPHEVGGVYSNGIITRRYARGQDITIETLLTTNHGGWMEVKICNGDVGTVTQECFDSKKLQMSNGFGVKYHIPKGMPRRNVAFKWDVKLPNDVICNNCVIQWTYFAGNTWGKCMNGSGSVGCGDQETFINCADISIYSDAKYFSSSNGDNPWALYTRASIYHIDPPPSKNEIKDEIKNELEPLIVNSVTCFATEIYKLVPGMQNYCVTQCLRYPPLCHPSVCRCVKECDPIGEFMFEKDADIFCNQHCLKVPPECPEDKCKCY